MACFHLSVKIISRGGGKSAVGAAAYRSGEKLNSINAVAYQSGERLHNEQNKTTHDYTKKRGIVHSEIMLPDHAPRDFCDRSTLWNSVEKFERNSNARTAREVVVALPVELDHEKNIELVRDYVKRNFVDEGMCADFSIHSGHIHDRKDEKYPFEDLVIRKNNPHAHIMLTVRPLNNDGSWGAKSKKEYILDKNDERIKLKSGEWKSRKVDVADWDKTETLMKWREDWAKTTNRAYERLSIDERVDHRSLKAQGIEREPTIHMGVKAWNLEKKGIKTERGEMNRAIIRRNAERNITTMKNAEHIHELKQACVILDKKIAELQAISTETKQEINILRIKSEEITERAGQMKNMGERRKHAEDYFIRTYGINPEQAAAEFERLEVQRNSKRNLYEKLQEKLMPLVEEREHFNTEYQRLLEDVKNEQRRELIERREYERVREQERGFTR